MAFSGTITNLTNGSSPTSVTSQSTSSISPTKYCLIIASIASRTGITANPNIPTVTGNGITYTIVQNSLFDDNSASRRRLCTFIGMSAKPTSGAITFDFGGQTQTDLAWTVDQATMVDTSGTNGAGAVVQSAMALSQTNSGGVGSLTVPLGSFSNINNATYGVFSSQGTGDGFTVDTGFTQLSYAKELTNNSISIFSEWKSTNDTTVVVNMNSSLFDGFGGIALEIKQNVPDTPHNMFRNVTVGNGMARNEGAT